MLVPVVKEVTDYLGDVVYGVDIPNLETVCMTHLKEKAGPSPRRKAAPAAR